MKKLKIFIIASIIILSLIADMVMLIPSADEYNAAEITEGDIEGYTYTPQFAFPEKMRGAYITPTVDFVRGKPDGSGYTENEIHTELDALYNKCAEYSLNTVIIAADHNGICFCNTDINDDTNISVVEYAAKDAISRGFYVYIDLDLDTALDCYADEPLGDRLDRLALLIRSITVRYSADGIIFSGYGIKDDTSSFSDYMRYGSGIGYENWLKDNNEYVFSLAAEAVRRSGNTVSVGLAADSSAPEGIAYGYILKGYADFIMLSSDMSIYSDAEGFRKELTQWNSTAYAADIPLFVCHINENMISTSSPDELVKRIITADEMPCCKGSVISSLSSFNADTSGSSDAVIRHFNGSIDTDGLNNELNMTLPSSTDFRTADAEVTFAGSFDPNFDITFNGTPIELNKAGRFYIKMPLEVGPNSFTFQNKGKSITYNITRTVKVLKDAQPRGDDIYADEGSRLTLYAEAYIGSSVAAVINGERIPLEPVNGLSDDIDPNSSYTKYTAEYTIPAGSEERVTDLGYLRIYGAYPTADDKILECITCGRLYINRKPPKITPELTVSRASAGQLIRIKNDNTMCYNASGASDIPTPDIARLPAGTLDIALRTVRYGKTEYYITQSGRRIRTQTAAPAEGSIPEYNPISVTGTSIYKGSTVMIFDTKCCVPFNIGYGSSFSDIAHGNYKVADFNTDTITLTFDYISDVIGGDIVFPPGSVFSRGHWENADQNGIKRKKLVLTLSKRGAFDGISSHYSDNGQLMLLFNGTETSLSGTTIVIDPGHGYIGGGKYDPGAVRHISEQPVNAAVSKLVEQKLRAAGANVIRLPTERENYVTAERAETARKYSPDLYVAIHCNSGGENSTGAEAYYFTPFSQPLADCISRRLGAVLDTVHSSTDYDRGEKYNYFYVTQQQEFPSVLAEMAFVSSYDEAMALADPYYQDMFAQAIADGIEDYLRSRV